MAFPQTAEDIEGHPVTVTTLTDSLPELLTPEQSHK